MTLDLGGEGCRSELVTRERRGAVTGSERLALDAHLATCAACRLSRGVFDDFDAADVVDVHDGVRIQGLSEVARRWRGVGARRDSNRRRVRTLAAAAALVVCGGSASAAVWWWRRPVVERSIAAAPAFAMTPSPERAGHRDRLAAAPPAARLPELSGTEAPRARPRPRATVRVASGAVANRARADSPSAAALLQQATEARQSGAGDRAAGLYRQLQREFPASPEAVLSAVPLGRLLLDGGSPRASLAQFDGYLGRSRGGALIPEALYGRARALAQLGDRAEERRTWARLCADFPQSAYAPLGRRRLAEPE